MTLDVQLAIYASTVVLNLALALAIGCAMATLWLAKGQSEWAAAQLRRVRHVKIAATLSAIAALGALLPLVSASMAEVPILQAGEAMHAMFAESHFGLAWKVGMAALLAAALTVVLPVPKERLRTIAFIHVLILAVVLYTRSMVSHAAAEGDLSVAIVIDWMHLCLIGVWVGEVCVAGFVTFGGANPVTATASADSTGYVESLSRSATLALAGILATGLFSAWHNLGGTAGLSGNAYSLILLSKVGLVLIAALLGAYNRFFVMRAMLSRLRTHDSQAIPPVRRFALILRMEAFVLLAVLVMAAILSATPPPSAA